MLLNLKPGNPFDKNTLDKAIKIGGYPPLTSFLSFFITSISLFGFIAANITLYAIIGFSLVAVFGLILSAISLNKSINTQAIAALVISALMLIFFLFLYVIIYELFN